jgi:hypothetical protein
MTSLEQFEIYQYLVEATIFRSDLGRALMSGEEAILIADWLFHPESGLTKAIYARCAPKDENK